MATSSRESRRRKIVERGPDRLALITGRIQSIHQPSPLPQFTQLPTNTDTAQPLLSQDQDKDAPDGDDGLLSPVFCEQDPIKGSKSSHHNGNNTNQPLPERASNVESPGFPTSDASIEQSSETSFKDGSFSTPSTVEDHHPERRTNTLQYFTPKRITTAITSTESTRLFCSVAVAIFSVVSHVAFPLKSIASFRPLYLLLLTNLTIVIARLLIDSQKCSEISSRADNVIPGIGEVGWAEQMSYALEVYLLTRKVTGSLFTDFSVYVLIVVCSLSLGFAWFSYAMHSQRQRYANFIRFCAQNSLIDKGMQAHGAAVEMGFGRDLMLNNDLVDMYAKCGEMDIACKVFAKMPERNVVSWTAVMCGFVRDGAAEMALYLFCQMSSSDVKPNEFTLSTTLKACGILHFVDVGLQVHSLCEKTGFERSPVVGNSIVDMYSKCGKIKEAEKMFRLMPVRNLISWNAMIAGYTTNGHGENAITLFKQMQEHGEMPDEFTFNSTLKACGGLRAIQEGNQIHAYLIRIGFPCSSTRTVSGALIDLLVKCGKLVQARRLFDQIGKNNIISWSALILGYAQEQNLDEATNLFKQLGDSGIQKDGFVLSCMTSVFADFALVEQGKQMHAYAIKVQSGFDVSVANSLVDMYLKCGEIEEATELFREMPVKNVVSWTSMITGYGKHGLGNGAIQLFKEMQRDSIIPDDVSYLAVLSACSHSGLVDEGQKLFSSLCHDRRIKPRVEHYACMVDLLGRAGQLSEAKKLIDAMPVKPNMGIWQTLLSACRLHGDLELGREVGENLLKLDCDNPVNYVMLSNMYAEAGYWKDYESVRKLAKTKGLKKEAGCSWVEIDKKVHFFYRGDNTHLLIEKINALLNLMETRMKEEIGYVQTLKYVLHDVEEESKAESLRFHSERLAIGLALVSGGIVDGRTIKIFKNLRVCVDCHEFIKGLSKILKLVFVVRDANRFHRFEDGCCSCGDYW